MPNSKAYINIKLERRLRERFKAECKSQNITVQKAVPLLMRKVLDGEISFAPITRGIMVLNKKLR